MTLGALSVRGKAQHRCKVSFKENPEFSILWNELDPRDQRTDCFYRLCSIGLVLKAVVERRDLLAIQFRHVGMQQRRRGRSVRQSFLYLGLARFELLHTYLESRTGKAIQDRLNGLVQFALDFGKFGFQGSQIGSFFHPQPVDLSCELVTEFLEEGGIHHLGPQTVENGFFQNVPSNCQAVLAGALVPGCRAAEVVFRDH
ncbi:hypothetical protein A0U89_12265 [Kozakia baliensis]|uniref:Uncharacterized protein n=1 Tax=Kozakia baliensis TaxID=153496 RepID=A0A1D8UVV6_9PROT|nr:hypothetical protein A0U89_12265 [Kozakia baliensis]